MDLVTLVTACALSVEPRVMQAPIFEQSGGQPWSFSVPGESSPRVLPTIQDAVHEARAVHTDGAQVHIGLTGLPTAPRSVTTAVFVPCLNITLAAEQIIRLLERCRAASKADPIYCAIAAYHGSWARPHAWFADTVRSAVEKGDVLNVELPQDAYFDPDDVAYETPTGRLTQAPNDHVIGWSSALFPAKLTSDDRTSRGLPGSDPAAGQPHSADAANTPPKPSKTPADSLFVRKSSQQKVP
jgi:hypothetical protein